jgi:hypothetical protein
MAIGKKMLFALAMVALATLALSAQVKKGETVWAYNEGLEAFTPGVVVEVDATVKGGAYLVAFFDGTIAELPGSLVRKFQVSVGTAVYAMWEDGEYYAGEIAAIAGLAYYIVFTDGDEAWVTIAGLALEE